MGLGFRQDSESQAEANAMCVTSACFDSDPRKVANIRAAMRHRADFEAKQQKYLGSLGDADALPFTWWSNFSRCLLKGFEHTWGLRYDMCYGGGFTSVVADDMVDSKGDPDNPNAFPYNDIPVYNLHN